MAPTASGDESVEQVDLHRVVAWPGTTDPAPEFVAIVGVSNLDRWSAEGGAGIAANEEALRGLVRETGMVVLQPVDG